jgi:hypothetical protein
MDSFIGHLKLHRPKDGAYAQIGNDFHWIGILHNVINGDAAPDNQLANYLPENFAKQQTRLNHFIGSKTRTAILYAKHLGIECVVSKKTGFGEAGFGTINHFSTGGKLKQRSWIDRSEKDFHLVHEIYSPNLELETFRSYKIQGNDITL